VKNGRKQITRGKAAVKNRRTAKPSENPALNDRFAAHLGMEVVSSGQDHAKVRLTVGPQFLNGAHMAHGGLIFTVADYAFALAANSGDASGLGINANIQYIKPGQSGDALFAEARLVSRGRRIGAYQISVTNQDGDLLAVVQSMAYFKPLP